MLYFHINAIAYYMLRFYTSRSPGKLVITKSNLFSDSKVVVTAFRGSRAITVRHVGFLLTNRTGTLDLDVYDDPVSNSAPGVSLRLRDLVTSVGVLPRLRSREPTLCRFRCTHVDTPPGVVRHRKKHRRGGLQEDPLRKGGGRVEPLVSLTYT